MRTSNILLAPIAAICLGLLVLAAAPAIAEGTFSGSGTVNAIDAPERKVNITHGPIPELKWPGMTMDFMLAKDVSVEDIKVGTAIDFELRKKADGSFVIESLNPAMDHAQPHGH